MAYNTASRFSSPPVAFRLLEPGAYQFEPVRKFKPNDAPFLTKTERKTQANTRLWTHALYMADKPSHIQNISTMNSKIPRFSYESQIAQDNMETIICQCDPQNVCKCGKENEPLPDDNNNIMCQGKILRRIYKGPPPRSVVAEGLSAPSKTDRGFEVRSDGTQKRLFTNEKDQSPPFYNTQVNRSTDFYQGCKWSQWTSRRITKPLQQTPGPAEYSLERKLSDTKVCLEKIRAHKRKTSKQLRFIEMVQQRNILEARPSPATYSPELPLGTKLNYLGPKAPRFQKSSTQNPGPADYSISRDFEPPLPPKYHCHAMLPLPSCFGMKAARFRPFLEQGPSPATYDPKYIKCHYMHCPTAGFGSSDARFKNVLHEDDSDIIENHKIEPNKKEKSNKACPSPTSVFMSKTIRLKPLVIQQNEQSPADFPQTSLNFERSTEMQYISPFYTSEGRFKPWNNWMPVQGKLKTPGPGYYNSEKPKCSSAVSHGPLTRAQRFPKMISDTPGPGEYKVGRRIETILETHNQNLKQNVERHRLLYFKPAFEAQKTLTLQERENLLLNKSIALLETEADDVANNAGITKTPQVPQVIKQTDKPKLLRYFLYDHSVKKYF